MITIAIAEDHQALIDGMQLFFQYDNEYTIIGIANDGESLIDLVRRKQPQIVITDIRMPRIDGITATKTIKTEFPSVKVIAFSMFDQDAAIDQMRAAGADGYVLKTSPLETLRVAIETVINNDHYYDTTLSGSNNAFAKAKLKSSPLSKSEREILKLIAENKTSSEIAEIRFTAVSTVEKHRKNMMRKLQLSGKGELLKYAIETKYKFQ